jgi:hypothetical protein
VSFSVIVSEGPTIAADAPLASDNTPAAPNTVAAFLRRVLFEAGMRDTVKPPWGLNGDKESTCASLSGFPWTTRTGAFDGIQREPHFSSKSQRVDRRFVPES